MKQVLQNFKTGELMVEEVPRPSVRPGAVLVQNLYSLISAGTEGGTVKLGKMSLLGKARARPEQVKKVLNVIRTEGFMTAYRAATRTLEMPIPLGYSCAGRVAEVGDGVDDLAVGDLVACGGGSKAVHAQFVVIPRNLCVPLPEGFSPRLAAFTTVGAIALQSLRIAGSRLGDNVVVIGLGLVGLVTVQLLKASGCNVLGIDIDEARVRFVEDQGFCRAVTRGASNLKEAVLAFSNGYGADQVIITAAAPTNDPVALAGDLARHKGRVVVVGRTVMEAPRDTYLFKELELMTSYAYGAGADDPSYEEKGLDYPIGYVRWTENRNMAAFVGQAAAGRLDLEPLVTHEFPLDDAPRAYDVVTGKADEASVAVVLSYPDEAAPEPDRIVLAGGKAAPAVAGDEVRVGVIGAGSFATNFLIPALAAAKGVRFSGIASATGVRAKALGDKYKFAYCASDPMEIVEDPDVDALFILTRHDTHADYTEKGLLAGKHVFVEKPMALTNEELDRVFRAQRETGRQVMVGFNRPYAALSLKLAGFLAGRRQPLSASFRANVGYRPPEHWLHDPAQGGGVVLGEACHFIDYCAWLTGADPVDVAAWSMNGAETGIIDEDNVHIQMTFADGSLATIAYLSCGDASTSRERLEVLAEGGLAVLDDFKDLVLIRRGKKKRHQVRVVPDKGYAGEVAAFLEAVRGRGPALGIFRRHYLSSLATVEAVNSMRGGGTRRIESPFSGEEES